MNEPDAPKPPALPDPPREALVSPLVVTKKDKKRKKKVSREPARGRGRR